MPIQQFSARRTRVILVNTICFTSISTTPTASISDKDGTYETKRMFPTMLIRQTLSYLRIENMTMAQFLFTKDSYVLSG